VSAYLQMKLSMLSTYTVSGEVLNFTHSLTVVNSLWDLVQISFRAIIICIILNNFNIVVVYVCFCGLHYVWFL